MNITKIRRNLMRGLPILIACVILSSYITKWIFTPQNGFNPALQLALISLPLISIWIWVLLTNDLGKTEPIHDTDTESVRKSRRLAKISIKTGNISSGIMCVFLLALVLIAGQSDGLPLAWFGFSIMIAIPVLLLSLVSWITAGMALKIIKKEGGDIDNTIKQLAKRGALFGALPIGLYIINSIVGILLFEYFW